MYLEEVKASFAAQGRLMADQLNKAALSDYLTACQNWAANSGVSQRPVSPYAVAPIVEFEPAFKLELKVTTRPLTHIKPEDFLPTYSTDSDAIGGPIGGPIPGFPNRFYAASNAYPNDGDRYVENGVSYVYEKPTPFGGFWVRK